MTSRGSMKGPWGRCVEIASDRCIFRRRKRASSSLRFGRTMVMLKDRSNRVRQTNQGNSNPETAAGSFPSTEDAPVGGDFHTSPPRSFHTPPAGHPSGVVPAATSAIPADDPTAPTVVPTDTPNVYAGASNKGKSPMIEEDIPVPARTFRQMEEDRLGEEAARRLHEEEMVEMER
nr:SGNH hydrolase-type esterase domain-containing protein [Tanacetum cinerariifolium]